MSFLGLPPETISTMIHSGAGTAPMLAVANAWQGLAAELDSAAEAFSSVIAGLAGRGWQGPAAQAMAVAAAPYGVWLSTAAGHASVSAAQASTVASVFESVLAATVHPELIAANRAGLVSLIRSNLFGLNAPAIAATEGLYEQMWAQDVAAMVSYHGGASAAAAELAAASVSIVPNSGYGNIGNGLVGLFNTGYYSAGIGNTGVFNFGAANVGTLNLGIGNTGSFNVGIGNQSPLVELDVVNAVKPTVTAFGGVGVFNNGSDQIGGWNTGYFNVGIGNVGTNNSGLPLSYLSLLGLFNTGNHNGGIGLTGDHLVGIGPLHISV